jgi:protein-S-isoprenylcysteine O-methyltransferase Ste14
MIWLLDIEVFRALSILFLVGAFARISLLALFTRKRQDLGAVKAFRPTGFVLQQFWIFLDLLLPIVFMLLGATVPSWVYGTALNFSFNGAAFLQVASVFLFFSGLILLGTAYRTIGQLDKPRIEVLEKHELVTSGPYSRVRHPVYMGAMLMVLGSALLFLNVVLVVGFLAMIGIAYKKAILEEELLASEDGFGKAYRDYMQKTGRFLPKL